jgi:hypothetical protein
MFAKDNRLRPHHRSRLPKTIVLLCAAVVGMGVGVLVLLLFYASAA